MGTPERIKGIISILKPRINSGEELTVVFSAFSGVTDSLIEMSFLAANADLTYTAKLNEFIQRHKNAALELLGKERFDKISNELTENHDQLRNLLNGIYLVREITPRTLDYVLSFGERSSNFIIAEALKLSDIKAEYLDARKIIKTNKEFGSAKVNFNVTDHLIQEHYKNNTGIVQIVTGFIAADVGGLTTTLGRGGSDYTAAIIASALNAEVLEIWTDVDGVLTCDPRKVKKAFTLPTLSYAEAMEMSHFGAKVIYPPTIQPAFRKGIPIYIKNTFNPDFVGTLIANDVNQENDKTIKGITSLNNIALLRIQGSGIIGVPGVSARLFGALGSGKINVILITQASSEHSICIAVSEKEAITAKENIEAEFQKELDEGLIDPVLIENNLCVIAVVGEMMRNTPGVAGKLFEALGSNGINVTAIAQGSSELNISFVINKKDELKALNLIHDSFFLSDNRRIHLFIVGVGLIGGTLIDQIIQQKQQLIDQYKIEIQVAGLSNSRKMLMDANGIDLENWRDKLLSSETTADVNIFIDNMINENLSNTIFIDNTANEDVAKVYARVLENSISVVISNKVATSGPLDVYKKLKQLASQKNVQFRYETNVGAGLPLISTLQNLIASGDRILKIEAVMSGSVSYIFNNFDVDKKFSDLVIDAKEKGFTEPDPREDLSGADVRRKVVILARECGHDISTTDVELVSVLPDALMKIPSVDAFMKELINYDDYFTKMNEEAKSQGKVLRFIGTTENGKAKVKVEAVDQSNPFYSLQGSDNMFVITTQRYHVRPIIIRGPGAGAEVTAAGVFADVLSVVN